MQAEHRVVATRGWMLSTGRGNTYRGVTTAAWESEPVATARAIVSDIELRRGADGRVLVCAQVPPP